MPNCKPGDLAMIINSKWNSGRFVEVLRKVGQIPYLDRQGILIGGGITGEIVWDVKLSSEIKQQIKFKFVGVPQEIIRIVPKGTITEFKDSQLLPIRPEELDETITEAQELSNPELV